MARLSIRVLGPFHVTLEGEPVTGFVSDKGRALLAYLAVEADRPHRREALAGLLWPDVPEESARTSLRTALANVRRLIGDQEASPRFLHITRQTVQFNRDSDALVDVARLTDLLEAALPQPSGEPAEASSIQYLEDALSLYEGSFLQGFSLAGSVLFEEWALLKREQLQRQAVTARYRLAAHYETSGEPLRALQHAWQAVDLDPWPGRGQRQVMRLLALSGRREAALAQFEVYRQLLDKELGVEPSDATRELYELLSEGEWPAGEPVSGVILESEVLAAGPCPYRGLAAFREEDAPFFFGRESFVERLAEAVQQRSMVAVIVGSSGCGKSSTVYAGLLPRLRKEGGWLIAGFRPSSQPFHAQAAALLPFLEPEGASQPLVFTLQQAVDQVLANYPGANRLLLVVDQFEELYTLCPDAEVRQRFLNELLEAVGGGRAPERPGSAFTLLLTLRADFMGQALAHRPFADALQEASLLLGPMTREELRAAIENPARKQGVVFETGLVERILDDVGEEPGNLPMLEFALTLLWEQQSYGWLTHTGYERIGRVEGALARYAAEVYEGMDETEQDNARRVFAQLVQPGEGTEDTRRVATRAELGEGNWVLVQRLADSRLVVAGRDPAGLDTAELVHEALIRGWDQLRDWMDSDRAFRIWQERLRAAQRGWQVSKDEGALPRGAPLAEAEGWLAERSSELGDGERDFILAGVALRDRRRTEREAQRQRELEAAKKLAEAERQRAEERAGLATRLRRRAIYLALALVVALIAAGAAGLLWKQSANLAEDNVSIASTAQAASTRALAEGAAAQTAEAQEAAQRATAQIASTKAVAERAAAQTAQALEAEQKAVAQAEASARATAEAVALQEREEALRQASIGLAAEAGLQLIGPNPERAALLALEALEDYPYTWQAENALSQAVLENKLLLDLHHEAYANNASVSPDGTRIATASDDYTARVWDLVTGEELLTLVGHEDWVTRVFWSPVGDRLLTASTDGTVRVWDGSIGDELFVLAGHEGYYAEWSPDGTRIVTYRQSDNTAIVWDGATGARGFALSGHDDRVYAFSGWSPDGDRIATTSKDGTAKVWDASTGKELLTLVGHEGVVFRAEFSPDGLLIATSSFDGTARVWDAANGEHLLTLPDHTLAPRARWSPDGDRLLTVSLGLARVWDAETGALLHLLPIQGEPYAAWSPDGSLIAAGGGDGEIKVWDSVTGAELLAFRGHPLDIGEMDWFPSGDRIWTVSGDGSAKIWKISKAQLSVGCQPSCPPGFFGGWYSNAAWSPAGDQVAGGFADGTVRVWDVATGAELPRLQIRPEAGSEAGGVTSVEWAPTGASILAAAEDGSATVWDVDSGIERLRIFGHDDWVRGASWSPDGMRIVTYAPDDAAKVWDTASGELLVAFTQHGPFSAAWSPDGRRIVTVDLTGGSNSAKVWDAGSGEVLLDLFPEDFKAGVAAAAWSPDGTRIVTFSEDQIGRVWDATTGEQLQSFPGLSGVDAAMWSPSGDRILAAGQGGVAKVWDAKSGNQVMAYNVGTMASASWSPDGTLLAINDFDGNLKVYPGWQSLDELIAYAKECCLVRELTPEERAQFGLPPR